MREAERRAKDLGATDLVVRTGTANVAGPALYQVLGYQRLSDVSLQKPLAEP